jgi:ABC-type sugar transport system substrate-binding protein
MNVVRFRILACLIMAFVVMPLGAAGEQEGEDTFEVAGMVFQLDQYFRFIQFGMEDAAEELGISLLEGNAENDLANEISLVNTYIGRGVDAIVVSPLSETGSIEALQTAHEEGITVVTYNTVIQADFPVAEVVSPQRGLGESTGGAAREYILNELDGEARIGILAFDSLLPEQSGNRVDGFLSQIEDIPGVEIVARQDAWLVEQAVPVAEDILTANPDIDILYAANEGGTVGAVQAVQNAGRQGETVVFGIDTTEQLADALLSDDNILQAVTGQRAYETGYQAVMAAVDSLRGEPVEKRVVVPGLLLTRDDPEGVEEFKDFLESFE